MKKLLFAIAIFCFAVQSQAAISLKTDTVKIDTAKTNKKINDLKSKLSELKVQLTNAQNQVPIDSAKYQDYLSKSNSALDKSKSAAGSAVGGDLGDAKKASKMADKAHDAAKDADKANKQLEKDRKKVISLNKDIAKTQEKIDKLQAPPMQK